MTLSDIQARQAGAIINHYVQGGDRVILTVGSESVKALIEETSNEYDYEMAAQREKQSLTAIVIATAFIGKFGDSWNIGQKVHIIRNNGLEEHWRLDRAELSPDDTTWKLAMSDA